MKIGIEEKEQIIKEREEGRTIKEIAILHNVDKSTVGRILRLVREHGEGIIIKRERRRYNTEYKYEIVRRLLEGESKKKISIEENIEPSQIRKWEREYKEKGYEGISRRKEISEIERVRMENEYLKKLLALVRKRQQQEKRRYQL